MKRQTEILWRQEKYAVMYYSQAHYNKIRQQMREDASYEIISHLIAEAKLQEPTEGSMRNSCDHMWGYFKKQATEKEKQQYLHTIALADFNSARKYLKQLAEKYDVQYLLESSILNV